jgi:alpha-tubulin suppressor-like RCC1 family protein
MSKQLARVARLWGNFNDIHKYLKPTTLPISNVKHMSSGYDHMGFVDNENNLLLYGRNHKGQCAFESDKLLIASPTPISFNRFANFDDYDRIDTDFPSNYVKPGLKFSSVHCGKQFTLAVSKDRTSLFGVGINDTGQLGLGVLRDQHFKLFRVPLPKGVIQQVHPGQHNTFVQVNDQWYAFGGNALGQLGTGNDFNELLPIKLDLGGIKQVSCGLSHTALLTHDGQVLTMGRGVHGQLGYKMKQTMTPHPVDIPGEKFDKISCGHAHTVAISNKGNVYTWGNGLIEDNVSFGGLSAVRTYIPKPDEELPKLRFTIPNYAQGVALLSSGGYFCVLYHPSVGVCSYGMGMDGQLGIGERGTATDTFVKIDHTGSVVQVDCGFNWACSISEATL